ncbi:MAG: adaptor protein MecA, partial [[Eubacterium] rectale]|nr:adaptor protein MecA [Agathobacter rectalis]
MKIEKVNDNQIRCTLTREDLADRQIKLSELAYGSEKARNLFKDMIQQANYEFGFEANDIPLMVEAIPLSSESVILVITKVEYPEELDTRFSKFSETDEEYSTAADVSEQASIKGADDILDLFEKIRKEKTDDNEDGKVREEPKDITKIFEFTSFDDMCRVSQVLDGYYNGENDLYKDLQRNKYYLLIHKSAHSPVEFNKICNIISEYAYQKNYTDAVFSKEKGTRKRTNFTPTVSRTTRKNNKRNTNKNVGLEQFNEEVTENKAKNIESVEVTDLVVSNSNLPVVTNRKNIRRSRKN